MSSLRIQYFADKEAIFLALVDELSKGLQKEMHQAINKQSLLLASARSKEEDSKRKILSVYRAFLSFVAKNTALYQIFREAEFVRLETSRAFYQRIAQIYMDLLVEGIARGEVWPLDPEVVAHCLLGVAEFIAMRFILWEGGELEEDILESTMDFILHGIDSRKEHTHVAASLETEVPVKLGESPATRGEATRKSLLKASEEMFGSYGFHKTSIAAITKRAGVAQGTFYLYFPSKVEIFTELIREINQLWREETRQAIRGLVDRDRREIERAGFRAFFRFIKEHSEAYRIVREAEFVNEEAGRWYYRSFARGYMQGLKEGRRQGFIRTLNPEALAYALMGIGHFMGLRWIVWEDSTVPEKAFAEMISFIMEGLSPED